MMVPEWFAGLWFLAGVAAIWIFYSAWSDTYEDDDDPVLVGSDLDTLEPDDPEVQRISRAVQEDAEVAWLESIPVLREDPS